MKVEKCKGMRDLFPSDMEKFRLITEIFRESCNKWGYEEVRTPTLEHLHLFTQAGTLTPGMLNKVYSFLDWDGWSGERVVLRPDATIPVARMFIESMSGKELAKLFYIVNTFIFEETGKKSREKWQSGAELIGMGSPLADVELIVLASEVLKRLGLKDIEIKLSHAGLTRGILQKLGLAEEEQQQIFNGLLDGDPGVLTRIKKEKPELAPILALQGQSSGFVKNLAASLTLDLPELKPQVDDFVYIADTLQSLGINYHIDIASLRGFEYYTGVIFQLFINDEKVGGGGRYDALIPAMGGSNTPASGFALYLDLLMDMVQSSKIAPGPMPKILVKMEPGTSRPGFSAAERLREAGYIVKLHLGGRGPMEIDWELDVRSKAPPLALIDVSGNKQFEFQTIEEVLQKIGG
ncbi:MAG: ATP phosphoribosyltransferase regulatory subunit [Dehalococcoidales bacterium]|nr:ATP phosphoribosyltransferase regulatory subunit [Dehalococcoidales bacterium]